MTESTIALLIISGVLAGFVVLLKATGRASHPLLQALRSRGIRPKHADILLCRKRAFVPAETLMSHREARFLEMLDRATESRHWRLCPHVRVADMVKVSTLWKSGSREWWQLHNLVSRWHCDVVIVDCRDNRIVAAVELDDRTHDAPARQRRDLVLEEILRQAHIPLLRDRDEKALVVRIAAFLKNRQFLQAGEEPHHGR